MNTFDPRQTNFAQQYQQAQWAQAEQERLAREARRAQQERGESREFYAPALAQLGGIMVNVGQQLQARYSTLKDDARRITQEIAVGSTQPQTSAAGGNE